MVPERVYAGERVVGMPLKVRITSRDPLVETGLKLLLRGHASVTLIEKVGDNTAEVLLWDTGSEMFSDRSFPSLIDAPTTVLALVSDEKVARWVLSSGAQGVLRRDASASSVLAALDALAQGLWVVDPSLVPLLFGRRSADTPPPMETLTRREMEVLKLLTEGCSNKQIAVELLVSEHTAKFHVNAILMKLDAETRTEAVVRAARLGIVSL